MTPSNGSSPRWPWPLVAAHAGAPWLCATVAQSRYSGESVWNFFEFLSYAWAPAQATLLSAAIVFGPGGLRRKSLAIVAGGVAIFGFYWLCGIHEQWAWPYPYHLAAAAGLYGVVPLLASAAFFATLRRAGWGWADADRPTGPPVLWGSKHLLVATLAAAIVLGLARRFEANAKQAVEFFRASGVEDYMYFSWFLLPPSYLLASLAAAAAFLGPRPRFGLGLAAIALSATIGGLATWFCLTVVQPDEPPDQHVDAGRMALIRSAIAGLVTLGSLWTLRRSGWRIDRVPLADRPRSGPIAAGETTP